MRRRHAEHFLALAEESEPNTRQYSAVWIERLEQEHDNLRAALDHLAASADDELVLRLAGALSGFWHYGGHVAEGRQRLESALRAEERPTGARAKALTEAAGMAYGSGDAGEAGSLAEQALALHHRLGDARGAAETLNTLCVVSVDAGDFEQAQQFAEESGRLFRLAGDEAHTVAAMRTLAFVYHADGQVERARTLHEATLLRARDLGFKELEASTLGSLTMIAASQGRVEDAVELVRQNILASRDLGSVQGTAQSLCRTAYVLAVLLGRAERASRLLACFEGLREQIGVSEGWVSKVNEETLAAIREQLDEGAFAEAWEQGRTLTVDEALTLALDAFD